MERLPPESMVRAYSVCQPLAGLMLIVCGSPPVPLLVSSFLFGRDESSRPHWKPAPSVEVVSSVQDTAELALAVQPFWVYVSHVTVGATGLPVFSTNVV